MPSGMPALKRESWCPSASMIATAAPSNTQLLFDADGTLIQRRRKITPTFHERMIWGQGDGSGLRAVDTRIGRVGALACWEHYNPLARYALMADHEEIHVAMFPGSLVGPNFAEQIEGALRLHQLISFR